MGILVIQDMPSLRPSQTKIYDNCTSVTYLPDQDQQTEFNRQLVVIVNQHKSYPSIVTWVGSIPTKKFACKLMPFQVIYNEGWGQVLHDYVEFGLTDLVKQLDPTRLVDSTSGWYDHGGGDFSVSALVEVPKR